MALVDVKTIIPYPIADVFALTIDLENAPYWHAMFSGVKQLTTTQIGLGSRWQLHYPMGEFFLEIIEFSPPHRVIFKGNPLPFWGTIPHFTVTLQEVDTGTQVRYQAHPHIPWLIRPLITLTVPPWGRRDLMRYFREFEELMAQGDPAVMS